MIENPKFMNRYEKVGQTSITNPTLMEDDSDRLLVNDPALNPPLYEQESESSEEVLQPTTPKQVEDHGVEEMTASPPNTSSQRHSPPSHQDDALKQNIIFDQQLETPTSTTSKKKTIEKRKTFLNCNTSPLGSVGGPPPPPVGAFRLPPPPPGGAGRPKSGDSSLQDLPTRDIPQTLNCPIMKSLYDDMESQYHFPNGQCEFNVTPNEKREAPEKIFANICQFGQNKNIKTCASSEMIRKALDKVNKLYVTWKSFTSDKQKLTADPNVLAFGLYEIASAQSEKDDNLEITNISVTINDLATNVQAYLASPSSFGPLRNQQFTNFKDLPRLASCIKIMSHLSQNRLHKLCNSTLKCFRAISLLEGLIETVPAFRKPIIPPSQQVKKFANAPVKFSKSWKIYAGQLYEAFQLLLRDKLNYGPKFDHKKISDSTITSELEELCFKIVGKKETEACTATHLYKNAKKILKYGNSGCANLKTTDKTEHLKYFCALKTLIPEPTEEKVTYKRKFYLACDPQGFPIGSAPVAASKMDGPPTSGPPPPPALRPPPMPAARPATAPVADKKNLKSRIKAFVSIPQLSCEQMVELYNVMELRKGFPTAECEFQPSLKENSTEIFSFLCSYANKVPEMCGVNDVDLAIKEIVGQLSMWDKVRNYVADAFKVGRTKDFPISNLSEMQELLRFILFNMHYQQVKQKNLPASELSIGIAKKAMKVISSQTDATTLVETIQDLALRNLPLQRLKSCESVRKSGTWLNDSDSPDTCNSVKMCLLSISEYVSYRTRLNNFPMEQENKKEKVGPKESPVQHEKPVVLRKGSASNMKKGLLVDFGKYVQEFYQKQKAEDTDQVKEHLGFLCFELLEKQVNMCNVDELFQSVIQKVKDQFDLQNINGQFKFELQDFYDYMNNILKAKGMYKEAEESKETSTEVGTESE